MHRKIQLPSASWAYPQALIALLCVLLILPGDTLFAAGFAQSAAPAQEAAPKVPADQLDSLVAPIALFPDPMLSQTLVASTYPLEVIQLYQWLQQNKNLKDQALADAVKKQDWDPSIQGLAGLPDVVKQLAENIKWTTDLGNAFLAQQSDVMEAVQRMRKKAQGAGNLKSTEQQKVETKVVEKTQVIVIEQTNPQVVYVPSYNPTVVYGPPVYPYPPIAYPPPGYYAAGMAISFGVGVAMGAMWGGGWGYHCGWGHNDVNININNNFNRNTNIQGGNRVNKVGNNNSKWSHNPSHRGGAPYSDRATANKFGGTARGDSMSNRQAAARQNQARSAGNRASGPSAGSMNRGGGTARAGNDRVGSRDVPSASSRGGGAFGGSSGSGASARASSNRGASSMGSSRGGGMSRGGGGMSRGGGGGRRR
ncbi:MAG: DUF3300 domain-containing protein [Acidobacteria bacterium]|nr:DUF3300 domain-containing protein [Acidobacteriota bacterium]